MKKNLAIIIVILIAFNSKSQQSEIKSQLPHTDYLKKSKKQRTKGFILFGAGVAMFTLGSFAMEHTQSKGENEFLLLLGGLGSTIASVPFFISAGLNNRKARILVKREAFMITPNRRSNIPCNSISLRLDL